LQENAHWETKTFKVVTIEKKGILPKSCFTLSLETSVFQSSFWPTEHIYLKKLQNKKEKVEEKTETSQFFSLVSRLDPFHALS
jgi:hypothetical protein